MAAVEITISGVLFDKLSRSSRPCVLIGEASLTGLEVGGGPLPGGPGGPVHIWGPTDPRPGWGLPGPQPPTGKPPGFWGGGSEGFPTPPIVIPPDQVPQPPEIPPPGSTSPVPPPAGSPGWPVQPVTPPPYIVVNYPGFGPVYVTAPPTAVPA